MIKKTRLHLPLKKISWSNTIFIFIYYANFLICNGTFDDCFDSYPCKLGTIHIHVYKKLNKSGIFIRNIRCSYYFFTVYLNLQYNLILHKSPTIFQNLDVLIFLLKNTVYISIKNCNLVITYFLSTRASLSNNVKLRTRHEISFKQFIRWEI